MQASGEGVQSESRVTRFDDFRLNVTQSIDFMPRFFEYFKLICLSPGTQVGNQDLAIFLVGVRIDRRDDGPTLAPKDEVITFGMVLKVSVEVDAPLRVDLVMHKAIISSLTEV